MTQSANISIITIWEDNITKLKQKSPINLISIYKQRKYKYAIIHYNDLKEYENIYPEDTSIINSPKLKGITKIRMKRRVEYMNSTNPNYHIA